jgi:hypothetical protein
MINNLQLVNWRLVLILTICLIIVHFLLHGDNFQPFVEESPTDLAATQLFPDLIGEPNSVKLSHSGPVRQYDSPADAVPHRKPAQHGTLPIFSGLDDQWPLDNNGVEEKGYTDPKPSNIGHKKVSVDNDNNSKEEGSTTTSNLPGQDRGQPGHTSASNSNGKPTSNAEPTTAEDQTTSVNNSADLMPTSVSQDPISTSEATPEDEYVAICMAVKDQALNLPEFLIHHYHYVGIRRFYIMHDGSEPPLSSITDYGVPNSVLTFEWQDQNSRGGGHSQQLLIYSRCTEHYGAKHTWIAFLDGDEFLETTGNKTLKEILTKFEEDDGIGALGVNWQMHTSSGLLKRPESARKSFVECIWDDEENGGKNSNNTHVKSIVRTDKAIRPVNPHLWL